MPMMDGFMLAEKIRKISSFEPVKLLLLSSVSDSLSKEEIQKKGIEGYLNKPVKLIELYNLITHVIPSEKETKSTIRKELILEKLNVLVVEDNEINRKVAQLTLQNVVANLEMAENGQQALQCWETGNFDLLLMDIQMPVMNGYEATQMIRKIERDRKEENPVLIVAMSANAMKEDVEYSYSIGMNAYMTKPFKVNDLRNVLSELVE
jgi:CheY-like chemotaxis protein